MRPPANAGTATHLHESTAPTGQRAHPGAGAAGAAGVARRLLAQTLWECRLVLKNGEQLLLTLVLPVLALVGLSGTDVVGVAVPEGSTAVDVVAPGVLAMAVMSTAFTSQAIATGFDRRHGVLRLLGTTPLGRGGLLLSRTAAVLTIEVLQVVLLSAVAVALGWRPGVGAWLLAVPLLVLGTAAFSALALLLAGTLRAEAVLAVANLVWVLLVLAGGVLLPLAQLPAPLAAAGAWLPSGALAEGLRDAFLTGGIQPAVPAVLAAWALGASAACVRWFRWD
jgi:ABC-2 type transport system permease protein